MGKTLEECYEILGLEYGAKEDEIKSAYRKKALKCHPDKNPDDPLSTQKFQELGHAYRRLTGEEDSDDDDYDDDDMDIWRDFFFFLFRDEILARVRCKCSRCGRAGEQEDDDFLASLAKEQEEQYKFTEEEMSQFTCFANLKEQREANKKKFCDERNQSNIKPEQKAIKGHKPKVKSNKQLKVEQWKREKEISEMAAQISQTNQKLPGKKTSSKDAKTIDPHQQKSCYQHVVGDRKKDVKEPPESSTNKRNARKKKNRNKSKQHGDKETESSQNIGFAKTTLAEQKVASSFVVQDAVRNVTIKPETTKRQDDITGRLPRYTRYISPRMMKTQARVQDSTMSRQKNVLPEQTARGWFDNQKPGTASRASFGANIWQKRQEKQQFLAELQPSSQTDEELQLQLALELSKKQAEIDAQQREINLLERQMEETLQIEKQFQKITSVEETLNTAAANAVTDPGKFATAGIPRACEPAVNEVEEWDVAPDSEDEWQESEQVSNFSDEDASNDEENSFTIDEASEQQHKSENHGLDEKHLAEGLVSSGKISLTVPESSEQLAQLSEGHDSQDCCPYGKNCCLGKHCLYTHPQSIDNRKNLKCVDITSSSNEKCDRSCSERAGSPTEKHYSPVMSFEEVPEPSDLGYPADKPGQSYNALISNHKDSSTTNESLFLTQPGSSVDQVPEAEDTSTTEQSIPAGNSVPFGHVGGTGLSKDSNQCGLASSKHQDLSQDNKTGLASPPEDRSLSSEEKSRSTHSSDFQTHSSDHLVDLNADPGIVNYDPGKDDGGGSTAVCENPVAGKAPIPNSDVKGPTVYVIADQSQFPLGFPAASAVKQSVASLPPLVNLSAGAKLQNVPQTSQHSSSLRVSYAGQMPTGLPANLGAKTLTSVPQISRPVVTIPRTVSSASQNSTSSSCSETPEASAATQQPISALSSTLSQEGVTNGFPAIPGFPFVPFGNVFPFLNPANAAANASLMAAGGGGSGIPFPIMPGTSNFIPNQQGGQFVPPYLNMDPRSGVSPLGQYLPLQTQLSNLPGMTMEGSVSRPPPLQPQPSQAVVANNPQSAAPTVQQPFRFPFPFIDPQAFVNMNSAMAMGIPYSVLQNGCQTSLQSGTAPQSQALNKTTDLGRVLLKGAGTTKTVEVNPDIGLERGESVSCGSKTPSLRRPATVPKVIQHQASKSS